MDDPLGSFDDKVKLRFLLNELEFWHIFCADVTMLKWRFYQSWWLMLFKQNVTAAIQKMNTSGLLIPQSYIGYTYFRLFWMCNMLCMFSICLPVTSFFLLFDIYHCLQLSAFLRKWNTWREEIFVNYNSKIWNSLECNFRITCFRINFTEYYLHFIS